jgi:hypothetical protein
VDSGPWTVKGKGSKGKGSKGNALQLKGMLRNRHFFVIARNEVTKQSSVHVLSCGRQILGLLRYARNDMKVSKWAHLSCKGRDSWLDVMHETGISHT